MLSADLSASGATQADAVPSFTKFDTNDCVREPLAEFSVPQEVTPFLYSLQFAPDGTSWRDFGSGAVGSKQIFINLAAIDQSFRSTGAIRLAFQYRAVGGAISTGPWGSPLSFPSSIVWTNSQVCLDKRAADAEAARLALLPGEPRVGGVVYFDNSTINFSYVSPVKQTKITSYEYGITFDGRTWETIQPTVLSQSGSGSSSRPSIQTDVTRVLRVSNPEPTRNVSSLRIRALNETGAGPWVVAPTGRQPGESQVQVSRSYSSLGYSLFTNPIAMPGSIVSTALPVKGCTYGSMELSELSAGDILSGDTFSILTALEEREYAPNLAAQLDGQKGQRTVQAWKAGVDVEQVAIRIQLCPADVKDFTPRYLRVKLTNSRTQNFIEGRVLVLEKSNPLGAVIENTKVFCGFENYTSNSQARFRHNILIDQPIVQTTSKGTGVIRGTLFRSGLVAANQSFQVLKQSGTKFVPLKSGKTDSSGQFLVEFNFPKSSSGSHNLVLVVQESATGTGLVNEAFASIEVSIPLTWSSKGLRYQGQTTDWIPTQDPRCDQGISSLSNAEEDERHPVAWFVAKKIYHGMKDKPSRTSERTTTTATGPRPVPSVSGTRPGTSVIPSGPKRCWVSGYTTKKGKRVSGYWRSC